jgi:hypothetical protein
MFTATSERTTQNRQRRAPRRWDARPHNLEHLTDRVRADLGRVTALKTWSDMSHLAFSDPSERS